MDSRGVAVRNGIDGEKQVLLDARFQYIARINRYQAGLFLEVYNLLNRRVSATRPAPGIR